MDALAWLVVKASLTASAACGLFAAVLETVRILRDHTEGWEGEVS